MSGEMPRQRSKVVSVASVRRGSNESGKMSELPENGFEAVSMDTENGTHVFTAFPTSDFPLRETALCDEEQHPKKRIVPQAISIVCRRGDPEIGRWVCTPYRGAALRQVIEKATADESRPPYEEIVNELRNQGVRVYIVGYDSTDLLDDVLSVVEVVSRNDRRGTYRDKQRCLLYRDEADRVFNLKIRGDLAGLAGSWQSLMLEFSGFQAMIAVTVLARAFPCISIGGITGVRPGYLSLILGLVLAEEISHVMLNVGMLVQGRPSVSAYALKTRIAADWPRKLVVFSLAIASAAPQNSLTQRWITFTGILLAELVLIANLGSRAWYYLNMNPLKYGGYFSPFVAFLVAVFTGLTVPYLGSRQVLAGGKAAMEGVLKNAVLVAIVFVLSDIDKLQQFIIVGSETCNQDGVNIGVGIWYMVSLITSLSFVAKMKVHQIKPEESEPVLAEDHSSPVGFKVPDLPDVSIDPDLSRLGYPCCTLGLEFTLGIILAIGAGGAVVFTAFTTLDDKYLNQNLDIP